MLERWQWISNTVAVKAVRVDNAWIFLFKGEPLPSTLGWADELLSTEEHARAQRFVFDLHRNRFRFRRALLRCVLAAAQQVQPTDIRFASNVWGKPAWANRHACRPLHFNLSHSGDAVAIAISTSATIGVDIEQHRSLPEIHSMARMVMHPEELHRWQELPRESQAGWFFNLWSLKEAVLKCVGCGLAVDPASFCVIPDAAFDTSHPIQLRDPNHNAWTMQFQLLDSFNGFSSAVCLTQAD